MKINKTHARCLSFIRGESKLALRTGRITWPWTSIPALLEPFHWVIGQLGRFDFILDFPGPGITHILGKLLCFGLVVLRTARRSEQSQAEKHDGQWAYERIHC
jgi:hypothetical protein